MNKFHSSHTGLLQVKRSLTTAKFMLFFKIVMFGKPHRDKNRAYHFRIVKLENLQHLGLKMASTPLSQHKNAP